LSDITEYGIIHVERKIYSICVRSRSWRCYDF